jgi:hypothetical protein
MSKPDRRSAPFASTLFCALAWLMLFLPPAARAGEWTHYTVGEVSFDAPAAWQVASKRRNRDVTLKSPDGKKRLLAFWWFPDEPLLGFDDIKWHRRVTVAGKPALLIHSAFPANQSLKLVFDEARADKKRFILLFDAEGEDLSRGSPLFDAILERVVYGGKNSDARQPVNTGGGPSAARTPPADAGAAALHDEGGGFGLAIPAGWTKSSAERNGQHILALAAPDRRALAVIISASARADAKPEAIFADYEALLFEQSFFTDSIDGDEQRQITGLPARFLDMYGETYAIEGIRPAFDRGRLHKYTFRNDTRAFEILLLFADKTLPPALDGIVASFRLGGSAATVAHDAPDTAAGPPAAVYQRFGRDCLNVDLANWRHPVRGVLQSRPQAHLAWVLLCRNRSYPVFGAHFDYDPQGATKDFFYPLYLEMLEANSHKPFSFVAVNDNLAIHVSGEKEAGLAIDMEDLANANGSTSQGGMPDVVTEPKPAEPVAAKDATIGASGDPLTPLGEGATQKAVLFDGRTLGERWSTYSAHGGDYRAYARFEGGALFVDMPEKSAWAKTGLYSEPALVFLDRFGEGAEVSLTFTFDPARTSGFVIALATHYGLNGNDPGYPRFLLHWRKQKDGSAKVSLSRDREAVAETASASADAPGEVKLILTPAGVRVAAAGVPGDTIPWPEVAEGQGFRIYVYSHPDARDEPVRMALRQIVLERKAGKPAPPAQPAARVEPLPVQVLFDGQPGGRWQTTGASGADFAKHGRFQAGRMVVELPEKQEMWGKIGLLSSEPVLDFNERIEFASHLIRIKADPRATSGFQVMFHTDKTADMWNQYLSGAVSFIRYTQGKWAGKHLLTLRTGNGPYGIWERPVDSAWVDQHWDGTLEIENGDRWMAVHLPGAVSLRGTGFNIGKGSQKHMTVYCHPEKAYGPARLVLERIEAGWRTPAGMSQFDRWHLVDDAAFDAEGFIADLAEGIDAESYGQKETE